MRSTARVPLSVTSPSPSYTATTSSSGRTRPAASSSRAYEEFGLGVLGVKEVTPEAITKYSSLKVEPIHDNYYKCTDMVEKPTPDKILSLFSILGRCVLPPDIFDILDNTNPGAGGEIQLTDAMGTMARNKGMIAVDFDRHTLRHGQ